MILIVNYSVIENVKRLDKTPSGVLFGDPLIEPSGGNRRAAFIHNWDKDDIPWITGKTIPSGKVVYDLPKDWRHE